MTSDHRHARADERGKLVRRQLPQADESIDSWKRSNAHERPVSAAIAPIEMHPPEQIEYTDDRQLIEQIVLEPQHDPVAAPARSRDRLVCLSEARFDRLVSDGVVS